VKFIDPDGRESKSILEKIKETAYSVDQYILENKEALLVIALGGVQIAGFY
jgi:hypothetical protein